MRFERTRALMTGLVAATSLDRLLPGEDDAYHLVVGPGDGVEVSLYAEDDEALLLVSPITQLPLHPATDLMMRLLRSNLYDSENAPFQIAADDHGTLVLWGKLVIADFDGVMLAGLLEAVANRVAELRWEVESVPAE